jgi:formate/nitrite transporter FocA (FNT family)
MQPLFRILVIAVFAGILVSLGSALYQLTRSGGDSKKMVRSLAIRVGLSVALFLLLMIAWYAGLIAPHGLPVQANP